MIAFIRFIARHAPALPCALGLTLVAASPLAPPLAASRAAPPRTTSPANRDDPRPAPAADPKASAERGRALAFDQARWDEALPLLAAGDDPALRQLASADLKVDDSAITRVVAGHDWWDWAAARDGRDRVRGQERAAYWYRLALPAVADEPRRGELLKMIAAADAEAEAFYAKHDVPRPIDPGHARLDRAAIDA